MVSAFGNAAHLTDIVEACCLGVSTNQTANSLGLLNAWPSSIAANNAKEQMTQIPGILRSIFCFRLHQQIYLTVFNIFEALKRGVVFI
jgi:hypothetical protein